MDPTTVTNGTADIVQNTVNDLGAMVNSTMETFGIWVLIACGVALILYIVQAVLVGALARGKGYSFFGNFVLGLVFGVFALIYEAGRPISYERECVMQDRLAVQTAKELYKLQRAREKAASPLPQRKLP